MSTQAPLLALEQVDYPDSDGLPVSDKTLQFQWIMTIVGGLRALFRDDPNVFVAGDLLWYPIEGDNKTRTAPDALVAFGRPKGHRGSYKQWEEGGVAPQVVFEIQSPGNRPPEIIRKHRFYDDFGVEEFYMYDPDKHGLYGWQRQADSLVEIPEMNGWVSPRLGIRFMLGEDALTILDPRGRPFTTYEEQAERADVAEERAAQEAARAARLADQLRALGAEPEV